MNLQTLPGAIEGAVASPGPRAIARLSTGIYLAIGTAALGVLRLAAALTPAAAGMGTHHQLGLPACHFLESTGLPCGSCGMTTAFAHAAHFDFAGAFAAQPLGALLFAITLLAAPTAGVLAARRVPVTALAQPTKVLPGLYLFLLLYVAAWAYKLAASSLTGGAL